MKTLVTAIQKGGQGKTFATCHLAFAAAEKGLRTVVLDLDTQANASLTLGQHTCGLYASQLFLDPKAVKKWCESLSDEKLVVIEADAALAKLDKMDLPVAATKLRESIAILSKHFDVCFIDTAPSLGVGMTAAVLAADFMLSPIELEAYSVQGLKKMVTVVANLRKANPSLKFLGMVPNKVDGRKPRHMATLAALQATYPNYVLPVSIGSRDSIAEALGDQMPVWKIKKTAARKATAEVRAMTELVFNKMEIQ